MIRNLSLHITVLSCHLHSEVMEQCTYSRCSLPPRCSLLPVLQAAEAGVSLIALRCDIQADADGHASAMFQGFAKVDLNHRQQEFDKEADSKVLKRKRRTKTAAAKAGDGSQADAT